MARAAEDRSKAECDRLRALIEAGAMGDRAIAFVHLQPVLGAALDWAAVEPRACDLAFPRWSPTSASAQPMAQSLVFASGTQVVLVPPRASIERVDHIAVARRSPQDERRAAPALPLPATPAINCP